MAARRHDAPRNPVRLLPEYVEWLRPARGVTYDVFAGGPEDGVPVLLVHGHWSSAATWLPLFRRLPAHVRVVAPHLRGHGRSEAAPVDGTPTTDFAGTGGGLAEEEFVMRLDVGDRSTKSPTSPLSVLRAFVADPASLGGVEGLLLEAMLSAAGGSGGSTPAGSWPFFGPGDSGVLNALSPKHLDLAGAQVGAASKPPIVWVRGDRDTIVSDTSREDRAYGGMIGDLPGWPSADAYPPQPMVGQTRAVLNRYAERGGHYREVVYGGCGHLPHIERPAEFAAELRMLVDDAAG